MSVCCVLEYACECFFIFIFFFFFSGLRFLRNARVSMRTTNGRVSSSIKIHTYAVGMYFRCEMSNSHSLKSQIGKYQIPTKKLDLHEWLKRLRMPCMYIAQLSRATHEQRKEKEEVWNCHSPQHRSHHHHPFNHPFTEWAELNRSSLTSKVYILRNATMSMAIITSNNNT